MNRPDQPQPLTLTEAIIPVASLILLVGLSYFLFGDAGAGGPNQVALVVATMIAVFIGWRRGHSLACLGEAATKSVSTGIGAIFILFAVGALIGTWAMSGTLVAMVYYGLQLLSPNYFYVTACAICGIVSASIGSSWTVAGTIGIGFMGIAANMGLNPAIAAGAIISGAYFGDKSSPLSDSANLAAAAAGVDLYQHIRETLLTSIVAIAISLAIFFMLGRPGDFDATAKIAGIAGAFNISLWLFLPLLLVVVMAAFKFPPFTAIFLGALAGGVLAVVVAPDRVIAFANGRRRHAARAGAVEGRMACAGERLPIVDRHRVHRHAGVPRRNGQHAQHHLAHHHCAGLWRCRGKIRRPRSPDHADHREGEVRRCTRPVAGRHPSSRPTSSPPTSTSPLCCRGGCSRAHSRDRGLAPVVVSRAVGDTATPTSALIPWNSCGAYMAATLGVATLELRPVCVLQHCQPAADCPDCLCRYPHAAHFRAAGERADSSLRRRTIDMASRWPTLRRNTASTKIRSI